MEAVVRPHGWRSIWSGFLVCLIGFEGENPFVGQEPVETLGR